MNGFHFSLSPCEDLGSRSNTKKEATACSRGKPRAVFTEQSHTLGSGVTGSRSEPTTQDFHLKTPSSGIHRRISRNNPG